MRITFLGHVGMLVETTGGRVLCDPWFTPAYFASWFPFPRNDHLDPAELAHPDFLYVSHLHHDHFDPDWLSEHVDPTTPVLLPAFETEHLERSLRGCGFREFVRMPDSELVDLGGGLEAAVVAMTAPADGPIGDSALVLADPSARFLNQNDARPRDLQVLEALGPFDAHATQFSGAIWYPMVYDFPPDLRHELAVRKRRDQMDRARHYIEDLKAPHVFPVAGPPCFLDDDLFHLNDLHDDPANIFPDQTVFLDHLREHGIDGGELLVPGTVAELAGGTCTVTQPDGEHAPDAIFGDKRAHLARYQASWGPWLAREKARWPRGRFDVLTELQAWWEPVLDVAPLTRAGVGGAVAFVLTDDGERVEEIVVDFPAGRVVRPEEASAPVVHRFEVERCLVESLIERHVEDWVNDLFLSCRFRAHREGPYNEYVYTFFKCLSLERMAYCEGFYAEQRREPDEMWRCGDFLVQRRCPHLRADLTRFGTVEDGILECKVHHWQFELETGRCLTSDDPSHRLRTQRVDEARAGGA